ncbi:recombinase XerC [Pseudomonas agarici]|uniref:Recombinase XerC n=2 Tax=Pseudomonas agarici TaxID=46677 RepID=A0A0X1T8N0_PSEAA|nr:site-specific integrase [Pseudomonas agarici]AMB88293.1 recombinase XerC [Pseudomonas agarici]
MAPLELAKDYIVTHDLRESTGKIYLASTRALLRHFGTEITVEEIDHRGVLGCRKALLENGLSKQSWNTYSNHLRTIWGYALEQGVLTHTTINPFKKTAVIPPKRPSKTIARDAIKSARDWLKAMASEERCSKTRSKVTPAWFWLVVFEMFYYTGIRLNALLTLRYRDINWHNKLIRVEADTEKTHREFSIPIMAGLEPHIRRLLDAADKIGFAPDDQLFNVNRFSRHYHSKVMNIDQIEGMYRKLTTALGVRMTPHRFRHTLATDLMRQPERNIHLTKSLLNHSNIATTLSYIEVDYDHMRAVLHERSLAQGAIAFERRVDEHIPTVPADTLPASGENLLALIPHVPEIHPVPMASEAVEASSTLLLLPPPESPPVPKLLTQVASISSERYSLEQAILPVGTGLSHELTWDGPGTWWEDLGIPQPSSLDEGPEASVMFTLMISRVGIKSYNWG